MKLPSPSLNCTNEEHSYRSGTSVTLTANTFKYVPEVFVQPDGNILSDHNPVLVNFSWSKAS
jgi:hypothetical protein